MRFKSDITGESQLILERYTGTNYDGTLTYVLGVDGSGNVIKQDATDFLTDVPTLQEVTDAGNTTTNSITAASFIINSDGALFDHFHSGTSNTAVEHRFRSNVSGLTNAANILGYIGFAKDSDGGAYFNVRYTDNLGAVNTLLRGNSSGNISIGTTANSAKLHIVGGAAATNANAFFVENAEGTDIFLIRDGNQIFNYASNNYYGGQYLLGGNAYRFYQSNNSDYSILMPK